MTGRGRAALRRAGVPALLALIVLAGLALRWQAATGTEIDLPVRADAGRFFLYAHNLAAHGIYSKDAGDFENPPRPVRPDALVPPGYPLFLAPFVAAQPAPLGPPGPRLVARVTRAQALLGAAMLPLAFLLFRALVPAGWALAATALTALSPHLVSLSTYLLSETLFAFLLVAGLLALAGVRRGGRWAPLPAAASGLLLGAAVLTRPLLSYFPPLALGLLLLAGPRAGRGRLAAAFLAGFVLAFGPWVARNLATLGQVGSPRLAILTLQFGAYPDLTYNDDPRTRGFAYAYDPKAGEVARSYATVLADIRRRFAAEPGRYLRWYLLGKPATLWSWDVIAGAGDVFVYPALRTPYRDRPLFKASHDLMRLLHVPVVLLALAGCVWVWLPAARRTAGDLLAARAVALALMYVTALLMLGAPLPRYAFPFQPLLYGMAVFALWSAWAAWSARRAPVPAAPTPR